MAESGMSIGELASSVGVTPKTIRYYEQVGLLPPAGRDRSGYRRYGEDDLDTLRFIAKAKRLGLSLEEIGGILAMSARGSDTCSHVLGILDEHLERIDRTLARLSDLREQLAELRAQAQRSAKGRVCGIIEHATLELAPIAFDRPLARRSER